MHHASGRETVIEREITERESERENHADGIVEGGGRVMFPKFLI